MQFNDTVKVIRTSWKKKALRGKTGKVTSIFQDENGTAFGVVFEDGRSEAFSEDELELVPNVD